MHILFRSLYQRPNVAMHDIHVPYPDIHGAYVTCIDLLGAKLVLILTVGTSTRHQSCETDTVAEPALMT